MKLIGAYATVYGNRQVSLCSPISRPPVFQRRQLLLFRTPLLIRDRFHFLQAYPVSPYEGLNWIDFGSIRW